uniref:NodB homology domain-containing protein n=1 Tax=Leptospirillum ferriphilum TaxID=178606 RepID=A0A7C3LTE1_9BACT
MTPPFALVLMYHQITPEGTPEGWVPSLLADPRYGVSLSAFSRQMAILREEGFPVLSLDDWIDGNIPADKERRPAVIVTFDDGYESDWRLAAPVLSRYSVPATFFVSTGFIGSAGMMTEEQLSRLARNPLFSVGAHGETHRFLTTLSDDACRLELVRSMSRIRILTGRETVDLSAPGGRISRQVTAMARESGFRAVLTSRPGILKPGDGIFNIPRLPVLKAHSSDDFVRLLDPCSWTFRTDRWIRTAKQGIRELALGLGIPERVRS